MSTRKYYQGSMNHKICYKNKHALGILASPTYDYCLYIYEEEGVFREFFSGIALSKEVTPQGTLVIPRSSLVINVGSRGSYGTYNSWEMTATAFAEAVKKYMDNRELITQELQDLLQTTHNEWVKEQKRFAAEEAAKKEKEQNNENWLNTILNSRK